MTATDPAMVGRRQFVGYLVKGSGLAVALKFVGPAAAMAQDSTVGRKLIELGEVVTDSGEGFPEFADGVDLTDLLLLAGDPYYYDFLIRIEDDNTVTFELPRMEQGQGIDVAATMIVAEELYVRVDQISTSLSPAEVRRQTGQITGGSHAVTSLWDPLRQVSAFLHDLLVTAAATRFGTTPDQVTTEDAVAYGPGGQSATYAELSDGVEGRNDVARTTVPKDPSEYTVVGTPQRRLDALAIATGQVEYAMDLTAEQLGIEPVAGVPLGIPVAVAARGPKLGSQVIAWSDNGASDLPGVIKVLEVDLGVDREESGIVVIARSTGEAFRARDQLQISWTDGDAPNQSDDDVIAALRALNLPTLPTDALPLDGVAVEGEFIFPYFAHAPMETMTAVADYRNGAVKVWTGAKTPIAAQAKIGRDLFGLEGDYFGDSGAAQTFRDALNAAVEVEVIKTGGSFGRRLFFDAAVESARISQQADMPVKLLFTRQDDTNKGRARPLSVHKVQTTFVPGLLGLTGAEFLNFDHRAATPQLDLRHGFGDAITALGAELQPYSYSQTIWHSTQLLQYDMGATALLLNEPLELDPQTYPVPTSSWRGIYSGTSAMANEIIVDEAARALGSDPLEFRRERLTDERAKGVMEQAVLAHGYTDLREETSRLTRAEGLGLHHEYKSRSAVVVEVEVYKRTKRQRRRGKPNKEMRVTKATISLDVNRVVNPLGLEAQAQGALVDAISYVIRTGLHLDDGAIRESSYGDFEVPRMDHTPPEIEVLFVPGNGDRPGGAGELVVPAAAAAIANAFARATGIEPRRFPLAEYYKEA